MMPTLNQMSAEGVTAGCAMVKQKKRDMPQCLCLWTCLKKLEILSEKFKPVAACITYNAWVPSHWTFLMISVTCVAITRRGSCVIVLLGSCIMLVLTINSISAITLTWGRYCHIYSHNKPTPSFVIANLLFFLPLLNNMHLTISAAVQRVRFVTPRFATAVDCHKMVRSCHDTANTFWSERF